MGNEGARRERVLSVSYHREFRYLGLPGFQPRVHHTQRSGEPRAVGYLWFSNVFAQTNKQQPPPLGFDALTITFFFDSSMKISFSILTALSFLYCFASFLTASSAYGGEVAVEMEERMVAEERAASGEHLDPSASTKKVPRVEAENMAHETTPSTIPEVQADSIDKMASSDGSGEVQLQSIEEHAKPEEEMMSDEEKEKYCESEGQEFQGRRRRR